MDLHQGSNEYNPLRSKPVTAAMKQEQKHIESSVYDPRTGKTVVSGTIEAPRMCSHGRCFVASTTNSAHGDYCPFQLSDARLLSSYA